MPITIFDPPRVHPACKTLTLPSGHRHTVFRWGPIDDTRSLYRNRGRLALLRRLVAGRDVVEFGPGLVGGIADLILARGCRSYTAVDSGRGEPGRKVAAYNLVGYGSYCGRDPVWAGNCNAEVPLTVNIDPAVANHPRAMFLYGIDMRTYLEGLASNSVVTVSTGFFHDHLLLNSADDFEYMRQSLRQLARVTACGTVVGVHHFMLDLNDRTKDKPRTYGAFFREVLGQAGVCVAPVHGEPDLFYLGKGARE